MKRSTCRGRTTPRCLRSSVATSAIPKRLGRRDERGVDRTEPKVAISPHELGDPGPFRGMDGLGGEGSTGQVAEETHLGLGPQPLGEEVGHLVMPSAGTSNGPA